MKKKFWCPRALQWMQERTAAPPPSTTDHQASMGFETCYTVQVGLDYWWVRSQSNEKLNPGCPLRFCFWLAAVSRLLFVLVSGQMEKHWTAHFLKAGIGLGSKWWEVIGLKVPQVIRGWLMELLWNITIIISMSASPQWPDSLSAVQTFPWRDAVILFGWNATLLLWFCLFSHSNTVQDSWKQDSSYFEPTTFFRAGQRSRTITCFRQNNTNGLQACGCPYDFDKLIKAARSNYEIL